MISACAHGRCPRSRRLLLSTCTCLLRMARRQADGGCPDRRWKVISLFTGIGALELATHESQPWVLMCYAPTFPELPSQGCSASRLRQGPSACRCVKRLRGARRSNDKHCQDLLRARMGDGSLSRAPIHDDVVAFAKSTTLQCDGVIAGWPCQARTLDTGLASLASLSWHNCGPSFRT